MSAETAEYATRLLLVPSLDVVLPSTSMRTLAQPGCLAVRKQHRQAERRLDHPLERGDLGERPIHQ